MDEGDLDKGDVNINFIPCLAWVRRGVAKPEPERVKLTKEELAEVIRQTKCKLEEEENEEDDKENLDLPADSDMNVEDNFKSENEDTKDVVIKNEKVPDASFSNTDNKDKSAEKTDQEIADEYGLDDYDDEDEKEKKLFGLGDLAVFGDPREDPYLNENLEDEDEREDIEDFRIRGTDNLLLTGHVEGESATLDVYVYNDVEDAFYVHHDIILPSLPLALEWLSFDPESDTKGNLVAVGSMDPIIHVWDLDIVDCLEPAFVLGSKKSKSAGTKRVGHKEAVLALAWNQATDHVLASGSVDQTVRLWDLNTKAVASKLGYFEEKVQALAWHPFDPQTLATGCCDKFVRIADCRTTESFKKWRVTGEVERVLWNHFDPYQCIVSTDAGTIHAIDVRTESLLWTLSAHTEDVTGISLSSQCPGCLVSSSSDKTMRVWDIMGNKPEFVMEKKLSLGVLQSVVGCPDAPFVVALGGDEKSSNLKVLDIRDSTQVRQRFGSRKLLNPLKTSEFGYSTANEAEPNEMETDAAAEVFETMSLEAKPPESKPASGGAAAKFKKKDKKKKKKKPF